MQPKFNLKREKEDALACFSYKNDYCFLQFHSQIEIYLVDDGEMDMFVDGKRKTLKKGELSVALSFSPHDYKTREYSRSSAIFIPLRLCEEFIHQVSSKKLVTPFITDRKVYDTVKECYEHLRQEGINRISQIGYLNVCLGAILDNVEFENSDNPIDTELVSKMLFYIDQNYNNGISSVQIAEYFGYSQSYISRYFKSCCGITLVRYINLMRLRQAVMLMTSGKHDTAYCILESGFSSMTTFYRTFKNEFGCSPKEYIEKIHSNI